MDNYVKIRVVENDMAENLWATKLSGNLAKINNIPFLSKSVNFKDIVRYCPDHKTMLEVVERSGFKTTGIAYAGEQKEYQALRKALEPKGIEVEGMVPGICTAAYPETMSQETLKDIVESAGAMLTDKHTMKLGIQHAGNTQGCSCCGKKVKDGKPNENI